MTTLTLTVTLDPAAFNWSAELATILTRTARQLTADWYATPADLPAGWETDWEPAGIHEASPWADLLERLPTLTTNTDGTELKIEHDQHLRVSLLDRTVIVEVAVVVGGWLAVGYHDGNEADPDLSGLMAEAHTYTLDALWEAN